MNILEGQNLVVKASVNLVESKLIARTWGNISCRLDAGRFLITPSGRDYLSLSPDDIVTVNTADCSYHGSIKPSSEKRIHAEVYKLHPEANFVIHTHQDQASIISASDLTNIKVPGDYSGLGSEVLVAPYALPGTSKLARRVSQTLSHSKGQSVIMKNHGALCFGKDYDEAFLIAHQLEDACRQYIVDRYLNLSGRESFDPVDMINWALFSEQSTEPASDESPGTPHCSSRRTDHGFILYDESGQETRISSKGKRLSEEALLHDAIYSNHRNINHLVFLGTPETWAISRLGIKLRALLDDFAQIVGPLAPTVDNNPTQVSSSLKKSPMVFIRGQGALCSGADHDEAIATGMITQKACQAYIGARLFGRVQPINPLECLLMRFVYQKSYSKKK